MNSFKRVLLVCFFLASGATIFVTMGIYNGYPFVMQDTGSYIDSGFKLAVPTDRPIIYGLFLRFMSLKETFWINIFIQGLIVAYLLSKLFRKFIFSSISKTHQLL